MKIQWNRVFIVLGLSVLLFVFIFLALIAFGMLDERNESRALESRGASTAPTQDGSGRDDAGLTEMSCSTAGGTWNPCGSACRTDSDAICIELCVEYCECKGDLECPSGYTCGDVVEGVGVCL